MKSYYHNVLIIGNGFDQSLGLKTSYTNFIESEEFKRNLTYPLFKYLYDQKQIKKWIDLEIELKNYAQANEKKMVSRDFYYDQFKELCISLKLYLQNLDYDTIDQKSDAANFLRENIIMDTLIINFNYTDTVTRIINNKYTAEEIKMHGSYDKDIIIGIEDNIALSKEFIFLKKSTSPIYPNVDCNEILSNAINIYFFGYSLGETDHSYFDRFFSGISSIPSKGNKRITFFYYKENGRLDILHELDTLTHRQIGLLKQSNNIVFTEVD